MTKNLQIFSCVTVDSARYRRRPAPETTLGLLPPGVKHLVHCTWDKRLVRETS
ncbi:hypothetical protein DPMN_117793 [Dreissena polymorpha]|uniref:Uncharacterized protein n=1 Tax=Dreissena polymorpha TaxID=45954 RepID=A0A9D4GFQ5_DREPO|nr:hypothetical protein DPMN_117793 [Dreissena polymorpha]